MSPPPYGSSILGSLRRVATLRAERLADASHGARVRALKVYQAQRFERCYDDLVAQPRYAAATTFFLEELYGPQEFVERDDQFARIVPALVRLAPEGLMNTLTALAELHALSESLDDSAAGALGGLPVDAARYVRAWQATGQPEQRERQLALTLQIGHSLERYTRSPMLRLSLQMMRAPAQAAGLSALQQTLERGLAAFAAMAGAGEFLAVIVERERALAAALFQPGAAAAVAVARRPGNGGARVLSAGLELLAQLP